MIAVGSKAPDFILKDHNGKQVQLSALKGKKVLLSFHPLAWTKVCAEQMKSLEANYERFEKLNTIALGLSVDAVPSKKAWAKELAVEKARLLSDFWPHGEVAKLYDIFREKDGFSERTNIIVNEDQKVIFAKTYPISQVPDIEEVIKFLAGKS
jgi:peroxiredoxin